MPDDHPLGEPAGPDAEPGAVQGTGAPASRGNRRRATWVRWAVAASIAVAAILVLGGLAAASEQPIFCTICHEMRPYHDAWSAGRHGNAAQCVDCHIDRGVVAHIAHKPSELKEVYDHFFTDVRFPTYAVAIPDARCRSCHASVNPRTASPRFSHALHEGKGRCVMCHMATGHEVPIAALRTAGVLRVGGTDPPIPAGMTPSATNGHKVVVCQDCHDQARMKCSACHTAPHEPRGDCTNCHTQGARFTFIHPTGGSACEQCHPKPAIHPSSTATCETCHPKVGSSWAFSHPRSTTGCSTCHTPPKNHFGADCATCHPRVGTSWAFSHPRIATGCVPCHAAPKNHFGADCAACHSVGVPFKQARFDHPGNTGDHSWRSFPCAKCHPKGYSTASCTCHGGRAPSED